MTRSTAPLFRQGDVLIIPPTHPRYTAPTGQMTPVLPTSGIGHILAYGEVTGHHHSLAERGASLYRDGRGLTFLSVEELTEVRHQEHNPITLAPLPEPYQVVIQHEWTDALEPRPVQD
jgi:hypothetical protein